MCPVFVMHIVLNYYNYVIGFLGVAAMYAFRKQIPGPDITSAHNHTSSTNTSNMQATHVRN